MFILSNGIVGCGLGIICNKIEVYVVMCDCCDFDNIIFNCGYVLGYYDFLLIIVVLEICVISFEEVFKN